MKLTQLGLEIDRGLCRDNLERILAVADVRRCFIRVDMEHAAVVDDTLDLVAAMRSGGHPHVGVVLQAALRRTPADLARVVEQGVPARLVKGAYKEPAEVAFPDKADVDRAFVQLTGALLDAGNHPAFATHDPRMIAAARDAAEARGIARDRFEFQMLYGVRRDLQATLQAQGHVVRVYLPFGADWFPYFMRRLAERRPTSCSWCAACWTSNSAGSRAPVSPQRTRQPSVHPVGDEDVGVALGGGVTVGREDEPRPVGREHGESVERLVERDLLQPRPVEVDHEDVEVAAARVCRFDEKMMRSPRGASTARSSPPRSR